MNTFKQNGAKHEKCLTIGERLILFIMMDMESKDKRINNYDYPIILVV